MDVGEALLIVESAARDEWRAVLMWACLAGLALSLAALAVRFAVTRLDRLRKRTKLGAVAFCAVSALLMIYAGVGTGWGFNFVPETGIYDAGSYFDAETLTVCAVWSHDPWVGSYKFRWFVTPKYDGDWKDPIRLPDANVSDGYAETPLPLVDGRVPDALIVTCYTEYVRPPTVRTNGVYHLDGVMRTMDTVGSSEPKFVTPGITIYADLSDGSQKVLAPVTTPKKENE